MKPLEVAAIAGSALVGGGLAFWATSEPKKAKKNSTKKRSRRQANPRRQLMTVEVEVLPVDRDEPESGWEALWDARGQNAIESCRTDGDVTSLSQILACVLSRVFPHAAPWVDHERWPRWMKDAHTHAKREIESAVAAEIGTRSAPKSYDLALWLMLDKLLDEAQDGVPSQAVRLAVAKELWPAPYVWPPGPKAPVWQRDAWETIAKRQRQRAREDGHV